MPVEIPTSSGEKWDTLAKKVKQAKGSWVVVAEYPETRRSARNELVKKYLERRGLDVEVTSRLGHGSSERPWKGWRTWARVK